MKAISLWQPWAVLWVLGFKQNETRGRRLSYRGPLAVQAAKKPYIESDYDPAFVRQVREHIHPEELDYGAILGIVTITDCVPTSKVRGQMSDVERTYGNYEDGRFAWIAKHTKLLTPVPCRGAQGFFEWPAGDVYLPQERTLFEEAGK